MKKILVIGATSAMAEACSRLWAAQGCSLFLVARDAARLDAMAADLKVRGAAQVGVAVLDLNELARHAGLVESAAAAMGDIDIALIAHGTLGDQQAGERDFTVALQELNTNAIGVMSLLTLLANRMQAQRRGSLVVISSVAGDRGRASNYIYGTAKGAVTLFTQGLRQRLHRDGVQVLTIKPGFVDTPMTRAFKKGPLWATPESIARGILKAIEARRSEVYLPGFWAPIMWIIRHLPNVVFNRIKL
jgi:decaprenylphospho-beta-D-erythro-pentofuranosid-2-ulose 2-reductase